MPLTPRKNEDAPWGRGGVDGTRRSNRCKHHSGLCIHRIWAKKNIDQAYILLDCTYEKLEALCGRTARTSPGTDLLQYHMTIRKKKNVYTLYTLVSWSLSGFLKFNTIQILLTYSKRFHQEISNMVITWCISKKVLDGHPKHEGILIRFHGEVKIVVGDTAI